MKKIAIFDQYLYLGNDTRSIVEFSREPTAEASRCVNMTLRR